jgi:TRAP-type C4-dicarboxylate transport system permease large subunit
VVSPSEPLVIFVVLTQVSIGNLFIAANIPGLIAMICHMVVIRIIVVTLSPKAGPAMENIPALR